MLKPPGSINWAHRQEFHNLQNLLCGLCPDALHSSPVASWKILLASPSSLPVRNRTALSEVLQIIELVNQLQKLCYTAHQNSENIPLQRCKNERRPSELGPREAFGMGQVQMTFSNGNNSPVLILTSDTVFKLRFSREAINYSHKIQCRQLWSTYVPGTELSVYHAWYHRIP